jgi:hypothetical protein
MPRGADALDGKAAGRAGVLADGFAVVWAASASRRFFVSAFRRSTLG